MVPSRDSRLDRRVFLSERGCETPLVREEQRLGVVGSAGINWSRPPAAATRGALHLCEYVKSIWSYMQVRETLSLCHFSKKHDCLDLYDHSADPSLIAELQAF